METPDNSTAKSERVARISGVAEKVKKVIAVIAILIVVMVYFGNKIMMGKRYKVSDKESVNYSEKATEEDAKKLAGILKANGYFDGSKEVDVLLKKNEKEGVVISFVISGLGKDEAIATAFKQIGEGIAADGFGKPLTIRLMDTHLNKMKDIQVE